MTRVKMLKDTNHPDLGALKAGEVVSVSRAYVTDYEKLGLAEETDDDFTKREGPARCSKCGQVLPADPEADAPRAKGR